MKICITKNSIATGICTLAMAATPLVVGAQNSIGLYFAGYEWSIGGNASETAMSAANNAGVVPQINWNDVNAAGSGTGGLGNVTGPNAGAISDNSGAATSLSLSYSIGTIWSVNQTSGQTGNQLLLDGYVDDTSDAAPLTVDLGNIAYSLYDVYVYISSDTDGRTAGVALNGGSQTYLLTDANGYNYAQPLLQGEATTQAGATNAQYVYFHDVSGASLEVDLSRYGNDVGLTAIQLVDVSGTVYAPSLTPPAPEELYAGRTAQFTVAATGTAPFAYQWQNNGVNVVNGGRISDATNVLTITSVSAADDGNYYAVVTNLGGSTTSSSAQLTVVTPVNAYEPVVLADNPVAYYRFNETGDPSTGSQPAFDYINGVNGGYGDTLLNAFDGIAGPTPADGFPGFESGNGAVQFTPGYTTSQLTIPGWPINTNTVTLTAWVYPLGSEAAFDGLVLNRGANVAGLVYSGSTDANGNYTLGYTWNNDAATYGWNSGLVPPANQWSLVALVVTPTNAVIYLANTNGMAYSVHTYPHVVQSFAGPIAVGNDPQDTTGERVFNGNLDELAVFSQALSQNQIITLFASASDITNFAPVISVQPDPQNPCAGEKVRFSVGASGSQPLSYQWQVGTNGVYVNLANGGRVTGATTATLTLSNASLADPTSFWVVVSNSLGSVTSSPAPLTVTACAYAEAVLASGPVAYYSFSESGNPAAGGLTAYDYVGGFNGLYGTDVLNGYDGTDGPQSADGFPGFPADNTAAQIMPSDVNGHLTVTPWNLNTNTVTITCWVNPLGVAPNWSGLVFSRGSGSQAAGLNFNSSTDANGNAILSYTWGNDWGWNSQLAPPQNQWSFVALVVTPTNATMYLFNANGLNTASVVNTYAVQSFAGNTTLGCDPDDTKGRNFNGLLDEVAVFNYSLSSEEIVNLYSQATGVGVLPQITLLTPAVIYGYPGSSATFTASVLGNGPFTYRWYQGTSALTNGGNVSGADTRSLTITNLTAGEAGNYTLVVTGSAGSTTSAVSILNLGVPPATPYKQVILAAKPYAYWRLNETSGTVAHDSMGAYNGTYGSAMQLGAPGQESAGLFGMGADTAAASFTQNTAQSWVTVPALNLNTNAVTIMAWVYPTMVPDPWSGIFMYSSPSTAGIMFRDNNPDTLGMYWNNGAFWYNGTGLTVPTNQWSLVALSVEPTDATLYVVNSSGTNSWFNDTTMNVESWSGPARIGNDPYSVTRTFNGYINEVTVFNRTLTAGELEQFYSAAITAQAVIVPPTLAIQRSGSNVQLTWSQGMLLQATNVAGPWTTNASGVSPFTVNPTAPQMFYRVQAP